VDEFDDKWLRDQAPRDESLIGSADIQSLADLGNSFEVVSGMHTLPVTRDTVLQLVGHDTAADRATIAYNAFPGRAPADRVLIVDWVHSRLQAGRPGAVSRFTLAASDEPGHHRIATKPKTPIRSSMLATVMAIGRIAL
jgi:hypothetical protein